MSTMAMASSSLNPDAPLFIPLAYRRVEDFSPEWWDLVQTTAWFRDHWFRQHQLLEEAAERHADADDIAALLPDDAFDLLATDDLFYAPDHQHHQKPAAGAYAFAAEADNAVLRTLSLNSPRAVGAHAEKPAAHHVGAKGGARRVAIHQPR